MESKKKKKLTKMTVISMIHQWPLRKELAMSLCSPLKQRNIFMKYNPAKLLQNPGQEF